MAAFVAPSEVFAARVDTLWTYSEAMQKRIGTTVILPDSYDALPNSGVLYPTVYILHGGGGDYGNWLRRMPHLKDLVEVYEMVILLPDGDKYSWYLDSPEVEGSRYETYISQELIASVESSYRVSKSGAKRAITGLSMGGHGALYLALRNNGLYAAAGSMSGGVDLRPFEDRWNLSEILGPPGESWDEHSVVEIARGYDTTSSTPPALYIDCGTEDFFIDVNRELKAVLERKGIDHVYAERKGTHNWDYWRASILDHLEFFNSILN